MSLLATVIITSVLGVLFVAYTVFAYRYYRFSPWNATWQGITLLSQKATMAALVGFYIADTILPGSAWPGRYSVLMILLTMLAVEAVATLVGLLHVQRSAGPVSKRQGTGYTEPTNIQTDPRRITHIYPDKE